MKTQLAKFITPILTILFSIFLLGFGLNKYAILIIAIIITSVIQQIINRHQLDKSIYSMNSVIESIGKGDYRTTIESPNKAFDDVTNSLKELCSYYERLFEKVVIVSLNTTEVTNQLNQFINENTGRIALIAENVNNLADNTREYFEIITTSTNELSHMNDALDLIIEKMNIAKSATLESSEMTANSKSNIENTVHIVDKMQELLLGFKGKIDSLKNNTASIEQISSAIEHIASETNLLSLNAAIEAARAGENGKGFMVVAGEIRNLSDDTADSLAGINSNITAIRDDLENIQSATQINQETGDEMKAVIDSTNQLFGQIMSNSKEAETSVDEMSRIIQQLENTIDSVKDSVMKISSTTDDSMDVVEASSNVVSSFNRDIVELNTSITNLDRISNDFYRFISTETIDKVLIDRIEKIIQNTDKCQDLVSCQELAKDINISQFQFVNRKGNIILSTEENNIGLNLFEIFPPYKTFYENPNSDKYFLTAIVPRIDGYYAKFCATKHNNQLVIAEYDFNLKKEN